MRRSERALDAATRADSASGFVAVRHPARILEDPPGGKRMTRSRGVRGGANFGCIVWLVVLGVVGYLLWKVVPVKIATSEFYDTMQEQAAFGSIKDPKFIEFEILKKADELKLPVTKENLKITKARESITVEAHYEITIDFFNGLYKYVWKFDPVVVRPLFAV